MQFAFLPSLPNLRQLVINFSTGLEKIGDYSRFSCVNLRRLILNGDQLGDATVASILNSVASSPSAASSLELLWLTGNLLTLIPKSQLEHFTHLMRLDLSNNNFPIIPEGSFVFNNPVDYLYLENDTISSIQPGAFQGILSSFLLC